MKRVLVLIAVSAASLGGIVLAACIGDGPGPLPAIPEKDAESDTYVPPPDAGPPVPKEVDGLVLWLDGADPNTVQRKNPGTDEFVVKWLDKSGSNPPKDFAPPKPENAPRFARGTMNGNTMSSLVFLQTSRQYLLGPALSLSSAEAFIVLRTVKYFYQVDAAEGRDYGVWHFGSVASLQPDDTGRMRDAFGSKAQSAFVANPPSGASIWDERIFGVVAAELSWKAYYNGASFDMKTVDGTAYVQGFNPAGSLLGASSPGANTAPTSYFNGYIAEVIVYNKPLVQADHDKIQSYLSAKWGIALADGGT